MADTSGESPKRVPKRNDQKPTGLRRNTQSTAWVGDDPDFVYQTFSQDPESPGYIGKRLTVHQTGQPNGWVQDVAAWEVCHSQTDANVRALDPRTDQGKPIDTIQRYGRQIRCRLPKEEYAKYAETERANQLERERQLMTADRINHRQGTSVTAMVLNGDQDEGARTQALIDAGHPVPGMPRMSS